MILDDTIVAISTAPGTGAIAVVRMTGAQCFKIATNIFASNFQDNIPSVQLDSSHQSSVPISSNTSGFTSHHAKHGYIYDPSTGNRLDEVVVIPYKAPHTYTGDDLIEINCHGSNLIANEILALCLQQGARLAHNGEFTQRSYLSGRIDLTQAEAVLDLIQAKTRKQGRLALSVLSGELGTQINQIRAGLLQVMTAIVAGIDFPEEVGDTPIDEIETVVIASLKALEGLYQTTRGGRFLREGLRLAIVGRPNAGKSSLLNQLLKFERAIVTDIAGTTRDSLEELLDLNGIPIILVDTAGIRPTEDRIEQIGIERTHKAIEQADLILLVADQTQGWGTPEEEIIKLLGQRPFILIGNKLDLIPQPLMPTNIDTNLGLVKQLSISAVNGTGIDTLTTAIESWVFQDSSCEQVSLNARQAELCLKASTSLKLVLETLQCGLPQDCLAADLKIAIDNLSEICGAAVSEEVIHQVFANFCIGK